MKILVEVPREYLDKVLAVLEPTAPADQTQMELLLDIAAAEVEPGENPEDHQITLADLEAALTAYYKREGLAAAKDVLAYFSAARVGEVSEELWPELMEKLK